MGNTWSIQLERSVPCSKGYGMCVALKHGLVIVSGGNKLDVHSLADGLLVRSIGDKGSGKGQFDFEWGGLCVSPDGDSVLVAECFNNSVQEISILDGSWVRFVGEDVLTQPQYVDCNADVIVVSAIRPCISVLSWVDGSVRAKFGSWGSGPGQLNYPCGIRLLADRSGMVVADAGNNRLSVFTLSGDFVSEVGSRRQGLFTPYDFLECVSDGSFIVANTYADNLIKFSRDGAKVGVYDDGEFGGPTALAALPGGGIVAREFYRALFQVFRGFELRKTWITVCVTLATHERRTGDIAKRARVGCII
jgi:hypothetical protein